MSVESITWIARRADSRDSIAQERRLAEALGLTVLADEPDKLVLQTQRGDVIEHCTPEAEVPAHLFRDQDVVTGYLVADLGTAATAVERAGFEPITDPTDGGPVVFQHFRGPDGTVFGLIMNSAVGR